MFAYLLSFLLISDPVCAPDTLYPEQYPSISIEDQPNGDHQLIIIVPEESCFSLSVRQPDGRYLVTFDPSREIKGKNIANIRKPGTYRASISEIEAADASHWPISYEPLFSQPGTYEFYFAENLETEPINTLHFSQEVTIGR